MPRPETMSQTATILVIDDEPQIRKFLRLSLIHISEPTRPY